MDCAQVRERISEWIDGEILPAGRAELERHLAACAACRAEGEALSAVSRALRALPRKAAPAGIAREVRERLAREQLIGPGAPDARRRRPFLPRWMKGMGLAAAALLVVVSVGNWGAKAPPGADQEAIAVQDKAPSPDSAKEGDKGKREGLQDLGQGPRNEKNGPSEDMLFARKDIDNLDPLPERDDENAGFGAKKTIGKAAPRQGSSREAVPEMEEKGPPPPPAAWAGGGHENLQEENLPETPKRKEAGPGSAGGMPETHEIVLSVPDEATLARALARLEARALEDDRVGDAQSSLSSLERKEETQSRFKPAEKTSSRTVERAFTAEELDRLLADLSAMGVVQAAERNLASSATASTPDEKKSAPRTYRLVFEVAPGAGR